MSKFGFIGAGNMGSALCVALSKSTADISVADINEEKVSEVCEKIGATASTNEDIARNSKYIILAVKPQFMAQVLDGISDILRERADDFVLVSIAAGLSIAKIQDMAKGEYKVIRVMPNTPALLGEGMLLYTAFESVTDFELDEFLKAMSFAGVWDKIPENLIDAGSAVSGCGPAFVYMFAQALADGAVKCGLPRDKALKYAVQTLKGSAMMIEKTEKHPELLKDEVCSPGGTTIAGVKALEDGGFRACAMNAVEKAYKKTLELGK